MELMVIYIPIRTSGNISLPSEMDINSSEVGGLCGEMNLERGGGIGGEILLKGGNF